MSVVDDILARIGPAVLLPIPAGQKGPRFAGWQTRTLADMARPEYLASLDHGGNIGVLLGSASGGLCSIDVDDDHRAAEFLDTNPGLMGSLQTKGQRGRQLWVRVQGEFPATGKLRDAAGDAVGEWRANGCQSVIHGRHPAGVDYARLVDAAPVELPFGEIVWPEGWKLPWAPAQPEPEPQDDPEQDEVAAAEAKLIEDHGAPMTVSPTRRVTINQMFFVARHAAENEVLFEPAESQFYGCDHARGLWRPRTEASLKIAFADDLKFFADAQEAAAVRAQVINARTERTLGSLVGLLRGHVEEREAFNRPAGVVHVANGMLHLAVDPPELRPFDPAYRSRNAAPVGFDPDAGCPRFVGELLAALDADDVSLVQRYAGALLLGRNLAQKILVLSGTAGGGKSTLVEIIERIIGVENVGQLRTELLTERFEVSRFIGRTLLCGKDVPGNFLETRGAHVLKALVGHDLLDGERKGSNASHPLRGDFGVIVTTNSRLRVRLDGDAAAWRRRLLLVRYERPKPAVPERDFAGRLLAEEGPGILAWMVAGARAHLEELAATGEYTLTPRQGARVDALLAESDSVREFVRQRTETRPGGDVTVYELVEAYAGYCDAMGWEALPTRRLESELADAMQEVRRVARRNDIERGGKAKKGFANVRLIGDDAGEAADL